MDYPLGRIHPHGSGGKSVYQRAGAAANDDSCGFTQVIFWGMGIILIGFALICLILAPESLAGIGFLAAMGKAFLDG
jgi:hypothetical protein